MNEPEQRTVNDTFVEVVATAAPPRPSLLARSVAELSGTFILVFMGVGSALFSSVMGWGTLGVAFGFAIGLLIAALIFGGISGAHVNPAVTLGLWLAGRIPGRDVIPYLIAQVLGATAAGGLLYAMLSTNELYDQLGSTRQVLSTASNGYGEHSPTQFDLVAGAAVEILIAALLVAVVLAVTSVTRSDAAVTAPLTIGLTVGFLVLVAMPFTNGALNPARATGTALWSEQWALDQLWLFWAAPLIGGALSGMLFRAFGPREDILAYAHANVALIEAPDDSTD